MKKLSELAPGARVWIYVSPRLLAGDEVNEIKQEGQKFITEWAAHGKKLEGAFDVLHNVFLVIGADESAMQASGCSIDTSVHFIRDLGKKLGLDFLNRTTVWYRGEDQELTSLALHDFWSHRKAGKIRDETLVYNTLVRNVEELRSGLEIPFSASWHQEMWK